MSTKPRPRALALTTGCAALLLALAGIASAVPVDYEGATGAGDNAAPVVAATQTVPEADALMIGIESRTATAAAPHPVIEPGTLALVGLGLVIIGFTSSLRPRRRQDPSDTES